MLPSCLVVLRRARLVTVDAGHAEIGRHVPTEQPQAVIELLHLREIEVQQVFFTRKILQRHARLDAVVRLMVAGQVAHSVNAYLHRQTGSDAHMIVVEERNLADGLVSYVRLSVERSNIVNLVRVLGSPLRAVDILERIVELRRYVDRADAAAHISVAVYAQHFVSCPVGVRRVEQRGAVAQLPRLRMILQLVYLIFPAQYRSAFVLIQQGQVIVVSRSVRHDIE